MRGPARRWRPGRPSSNEAIGHAVDHLSLYQLTIEEGTPFHALHAAEQVRRCPTATHAADLYAVTQEVTARARPAGL